MREDFDKVDPTSRAKNPLAEAHAELKPLPDKTDEYTLSISVRPHYQLYSVPKEPVKMTVTVQLKN